MDDQSEYVEILSASLEERHYSVRLKIKQTTHVYLAGVRGEHAWLLTPSSGQPIEAGQELHLSGDSPQAPERLVLVARGGPCTEKQVLTWAAATPMGTDGSDFTTKVRITII